MAQTFFDFTSLTPPALPAGWVSTWDGPSWASVTSGGTVYAGLDGQVATGQASFLAWDAGGALSGTYEVLARGRSGSANVGATGGPNFGVVVRGSVQAARQGYWMAFAAQGVQAWIARYNAGSGVDAWATPSFAWTGQTDYWIRVRVSGSPSTMQSKWWAGSIENEPAGWLDTWSPGITLNGRVGVFAGPGPGPQLFRQVGIGTGDDPAPHVALSSAPWTLTVNVVGSGTVTRNPNTADYADATQVALTAVPASGWSFAGWSGALTGLTNPSTVTMDANKTVGATFTQDPPPPPVSQFLTLQRRVAGVWTP